MCSFYRIFYEVYTDLGFALPVDYVEYYALSAAHAVDCLFELYESRGQRIGVVGYVRSHV